MNAPIKDRRLARRIFRGFAVLAMGRSVVGIALDGAQDRDNAPTPTGAFAVGHAIYDWTNDVTLDALAPVPGTSANFLSGSGTRPQLIRRVRCLARNRNRRGIICFLPVSFLRASCRFLAWFRGVHHA